MEDKIMIGKRIESAREHAELNQSQLARLLGVSPQTVQQWEKGDTSPRGTRWQKLAVALSTSPSSLQFGEPSAIPLNNNEDISSDEWLQACREGIMSLLFNCADVGWLEIKSGVNLNMIADLGVKEISDIINFQQNDEHAPLNKKNQT